MNPFQLFSYPIVAVFTILIYIASSYPVYAMAQKQGDPNAWFAFVPILNLVAMVNLAGKELWWVILYFVPCINIFIAIYIWMCIAENAGKSSLFGLLMIVPVVNFFVPWYLAFG